jgi:hypothetical protein
VRPTEQVCTTFLRYSASDILCGVVTLQTFNDTILSIYAMYQYTRPDGVVPSFVDGTNIVTQPGILQFGGEKPTHDSPPNMVCECCI